MRVREAGIAGLGELPQLNRTADAAHFRMRLGETFGGELAELLAGVFAGRSQRPAKIGRGLWAACLQKRQQPVRHGTRKITPFFQVVA